MRGKWLTLVLVSVIVLGACGPAAKDETPTPGTAPTSAPQATATPATGAAPTAGPRSTPTAAPSPTAAATTPKRGGVFRFAFRTDPPYWDFYSVHSDPVTSSRNLVFTKLFTLPLDPDAPCKDVVTPVAAQSWRWIDDSNLELKLKPGIRWPNKAPMNGREMTADDVVYSFDAFRKFVTMESMSRNVEKVTAKDRYTVVFTTVKPFSSLVLNVMATHFGLAVVPPEGGGPSFDWKDANKSWVGSGPFAFKQWMPGVKWTFERNPTFFREGLPYIDGVEFLNMPDVSSRMAALRSGQLDMEQQKSPVLVESLTKQRPDLKVVRCPGIAPEAIYMRTDKAPFNDVKVRRAISMALDRKAIVDTLYGGQGVPVAVLPPGTPYALAVEDFPPETRKYLERNPAEAKRLLAEAGFPRGLSTSLTVTWRYESPYKELAEALVAMLADVGVEVKLDPVEYGLWTGSVLRGEIDNMAMTHTRMETPEGTSSLASFDSRNPFAANRSHVVDPELDKLIDQLARTFDESKRTETARQIQVLAVDRAYRVMMPERLDTVIYQPYWKRIGWKAEAKDFGNLLEEAWLDRK